ncbi:hypothetical protein diail_4535 [Diaporthe ilicicola]|nr:hypothetical protein diail_4535 [Diaporthe ilicicola]
MKSLAYLQSVTLAFMGTASANSLLFFTAGDNCYEAITDHIGCWNVAAEACCSSADPFCVTALLADSDGLTHTVYFTNGTECELHDDLNNFSRCVTPEMCCMSLPLVQDDSKCSAYWHKGEPRPGANNQTTANRRCLEPNFLAYNDGKQRKIAIPEGMFEEVMEMYSNKNFRGLSEYEIWGR